MTPLVSVIVTTKNEEANLANCLDSVKGQTFQNLEIVVVDNHSTDRTKDIARKYTDKIFNLGPERSAQRNYGVSVSTGKYILYLDADMILSPNVVYECVARCEQNAGISGLYIPEQIVGSGFWIQVRCFERSFYDGTSIDAVRFVPKTMFEKVGGFDATLCGPEDWDFDKKIRQQGSVAVISAPLQHNEGNFNLTHYLGKKSYYAQSFDGYVARWGATDPDIKKQLGFFYRFFGVFIEQGKFIKLLKHPLLTLGMYYLRFRVGLSFLMRKYPKKSG